MADRKPATAEELAAMAASYRGQAGWLTRAVAPCSLVVAEATLRAPNRPLMAQLERCLGSRGKVCLDL
jgi:hypothetical protein